MQIKKIDETPRYRFDIIFGIGKQEFETQNEVRTFFLHEGSLNLRVNNRIEYQLSAGEGFLVSPENTYSLDSEQPIMAFQSSSSVNMREPIILINDTGTKKIETCLEGYRINKNPKRVNKPWGHELWISWFRDYHVLKQIGMKSGNMSSLQLHRNKLETNYLVQGVADVIDQIPMDLSLSEEEMKREIKKFNLSEYTETKTPGMYWTSHPGIVHRVISRTDYLAYETSTPELDDVIRLSDKSGRQSGRIESEHQY
jgi:hypothetical protein